MDSGGQPGNQNALKAKRWYQAIDRALEKRSKAEGIEELDRLAEKFLDEVEASGMTGFKELGDRLDGKPPQTTTLTGDSDHPLVVTGVTLTVVDPRGT